MKKRGWQKLWEEFDLVDLQGLEVPQAFRVVDLVGKASKMLIRQEVLTGFWRSLAISGWGLLVAVVVAWMGSL